jgi:hypothetical protein
MGHVWEIGEMRTGFRWEDLRAREHLEDLSIDGRIILKWIFKMDVGGRAMESIDLAQDWNVTGSIKCREFID